jgi:toxin ParE1/3/4
MSRVVTTTVAADNDIRAIATYIAADKPQSARDFGIELGKVFNRIGEHADLGRVIDVGLPITLQVVRVSRRFRRYLVFYRVLDAECIEVVRVLHGARDVNTLLSGLS